jgi:hypothetical protein
MYSQGGLGSTVEIVALDTSHTSRLKAGILAQKIISTIRKQLRQAPQNLNFSYLGFRQLRLSTPTALDIMQFIVVINITGSRRMGRIGCHGLGSRFTSIRQLTKQSASIGDVMAGPSQDINATGVWPLVGLTIRVSCITPPSILSRVHHCPSNQSLSITRYPSKESRSYRSDSRSGAGPQAVLTEIREAAVFHRRAFYRDFPAI